VDRGYFADGRKLRQLLPSLGRHVHVGAHAERRGRSAAAFGPIFQQMLVFVPPARRALMQSLRAGKLRACVQARPAHTAMKEVLYDLPGMQE
jgi:hypothetical protein